MLVINRIRVGLTLNGGGEVRAPVLVGRDGSKNRLMHEDPFLFARSQRVEDAGPYADDRSPLLSYRYIVKKRDARILYNVSYVSNVTQITTLSGGSLGSCVDEERS